MDKKQCVLCEDLKPKGLFRKRARNRDGLDNRCKDCMREYDKQWYKKDPRRKERIQAFNKRQLQKNKEFILAYLDDHPCVDCGEGDPVVLEFDHVDRKHKAIANMSRNAYSIKTLAAEIAKCEVRCANCHRRKTAKELGWYRAGVA